MQPDQPIDISIVRAIAIRPDASGILDDALLAKDKRSKKVGMLPLKARMVLAAASHCLPASASPASPLDTDVGVSLGTLYGSMDVAELCLETVDSGGFSHVVPSWYATGLPNATTAIIASIYNLGGPNLTFLGHQSGMDAIINGCRQINMRRVSAMIAGGFDMPSSFFGEQLALSKEYGGSVNVHPGVGLVWLSGSASAESVLGRIVGWSQQFHPAARLSKEQIDSIVDQALSIKGITVKPKVHVIYPGEEGKVDYLAATAPIYLVKNVLEQEEQGLHAVIAKGLGPSVACLLVQKN